mmetsp:Transcript_43357/g.101243  ORF Transcript_43357/g.101243 Transcript_43357/m.101243 type:complete len:297 (-) Transcript_43357:130-1020(-)
MQGQEQDSAIEYLLALQAAPRATPRRAPICCAPGALAVCSVERCSCIQDTTCGELDESFSTQASDFSDEGGQVAHATKLKPWQYTEVQRKSRPTTPPSRLSTAQVVIKSARGSQVASRRVTQVVHPRMSQVHGVAEMPPTQVLSSRSDSKAASRPTLLTPANSQGAFQAGSPCSSTRSAPTLTESRSLVALPPRWSSATAGLPTAVRVKVVTSVVSASATPVSTPQSARSARSTRCTQAVPVQAALATARSHSWQPQAAPQGLTQPMRYTVGAQLQTSWQPPSVSRPPMAQVVSVK